jgi:hypothetical protein
MTKMDYLHTSRLDNSSHDIYGCIVTVKKSGCSNDSYFILRNIWRLWIHFENMIIIEVQFTKFFNDCLMFLTVVDKKAKILFCSADNTDSLGEIHCFFSWSLNRFPTKKRKILVPRTSGSIAVS